MRINTINKASETPAHLQIRDSLLGEIRTMSPGTRIPGEPELATMFRVSRMTVNRAVLSLVRDGVLVREKGRGTFVAVPDVRVRQVLVALRVQVEPALEDYYLGALYWRIQSTLAARKVAVVPIDLATLIQEPVRCDGVIAISPDRDPLCKLVRAVGPEIPVVALGSSWADTGAVCIDSNNVLGAALAVDHLVAAGHARIAFLGALPNDSNTQDRVRGFRDSAARHELPRIDESVWLTRSALSFDAEFEDRFFGFVEREEISAVFVGGAHLALRLVMAAQRRGIALPHQLSIVGYDDPMFMSIAHPGITTVRQPLDTMAMSACEVIMGGEVERNRMQVLDPILLTRQSVAPRLG